MKIPVGFSKMVIINKPTMKPGCTGILNELFSQHNTSMLLGDAKYICPKLIT
ncbi:NAD(P)(+) transhydrogenase (Re/Si-specific) subunit beta [Pedobacter panaciterrae]